MDETMNRFLVAVIGAMLQLAVVAMAMLLAVALLGLVAFLLAVWLVRTGWARLTGRPVAPWAMPFNATGRFRQAYGAAGQWPRRRSSAGGAPTSAQRNDAEVTDVEVVREIANTDGSGRSENL
jgi:hypothetical protein